MREVELVFEVRVECLVRVVVVLERFDSLVILLLEVVVPYLVHYLDVETYDLLGGAARAHTLILLGKHVHFVQLLHVGGHLGLHQVHLHILLHLLIKDLRLPFKECFECILRPEPPFDIGVLYCNGNDPVEDN